MQIIRNAYRILVGKSEGQKPFPGLGKEEIIISNGS
jgi:hypothetical protein